MPGGWDTDAVPTDPGPQINTSLVSRYADLRKQVGGMTESVRGMRFNSLLADALVRDGIDAEADQRGPHGEVDVAFCYGGTWWLLEAKWYADPITDEPLRHLSDVLTERLPGTMGILASWSGFAASALRRAERSRDVVLLDRTHVEALISGTVSGPELIDAVNRSLSVFGHPSLPLAALLRPRRPDPAPLWSGAPDGFTPAAVAAPGAVDPTVTAYGATIAGITADHGRLLITVDDGIMNLAVGRRAQPRRRLELTDCVGSPLATTDGDLFVVRNGGVLRHRQDALEVAAGGFTRPPIIVPGPHGTPWLLDRDTVGWPGTEHASLVQIGDHLGDQQRWPAGLPAGVYQAACWLHERTFFVLGDGHSAITDVDTGEHRWIETPVGRPHGLIRLDERHVLIVGADRHVLITVLDTATGQATEPTPINLTGPVRGAARIRDALIILAGAPVDHATVVPVVARLDLPSLV
ncbi:restriction endonuclease [Micromonospora sp. Llam0]|nr:restriction endonuclease [Micromonospora sp. Llam0]